jgi:hypothetical protein
MSATRPVKKSWSVSDGLNNFGATTGEASASWTIPAGPGVAGLSLWMQGVSGLDYPLETSPVVGGIAR